VDGADIFSVTGAIGGAGHIFSLALFLPPLAILDLISAAARDSKAVY
jgi:hypothetical protein